MAGCPHCGTTVKETPQLGGKIVKCPRCQQAFQMPSLPQPGSAPPMGGAPGGAFSAPPPAPYAPPAPPAPSYTDFASGPKISTGAAFFRPREYPAIKILIIILYVIAGLIALGFVIAEILILVGGSFVARQGIREGLMGFLMLSAVNLLYCGLGIIYTVAMAEMLRLFLDIQNNTHETAYWVRQNSKG